MSLRSWPILLFYGLLLAMAGSVASFSGELTPQEKRGQQIYVKGISPSGQEIVAALNQNGAAVPASSLPCASCHGVDGRGKPEGGIAPSNITWESLAKPYGAADANGRQHPPYTERWLKRAITLGVDPAGNPLHTAMPRYQMSLRDAEDLIVYLKRLGRNTEPGVTENTISIGVILPPVARAAEMNRGIKGMLAGYFDEVNRGGGIFARNVELRFIELPGLPEATVTTVRAALDQEQFFALIGNSLSGADEAIARLAEEKEIMLLGTFSLPPASQSPPNRFAFYLLGGLNEQAKALAVFAAKELANKDSRLAIVHFDDQLSRAAAGAINSEWRKFGLPPIETMVVSPARFDATRAAQKLKQQSIGLVFFLGSNAAQNELLAAAQKLDWRPMLLAPSTQVGKELFDAPAGFDRRIFVAYPTLPSDIQPSGVAEYQKLAEARKLPATSRPAQLTALASAKILTEALKQTGREVSRERLIETLEKFYQFKTGVTPAITYRPNRRTGASGAYIVSLDLKAKTLAPFGKWIELD
jgi:ABC-type branched-subunit amino acid transport system substrate-binding protein